MLDACRRVVFWVVPVMFLNVNGRLAAWYFKARSLPAQALNVQLSTKFLKTFEKRLEELGVSRAQPQPRRIGSRKQNHRDKYIHSTF